MPSADHAARAIASLRDRRRRACRAARGRDGIPQRPRHVADARAAPPCGRATWCAPRLGAPGRRAAARAGRPGADRGPRRGPGLARTRASPPSRPTATSSARAGPAAAAAPARACSSCRPPSTRRRRRWMPRPPPPSGPGSRWARPGSGCARWPPSVEAALEALHESDARMAAVAEQLGGLGCRDAPGVGRGRPHRAGHRRGAQSRSSATAPSSTACRRGSPRPRRSRPRRARTPPPTSATASSGREPGPHGARPSCGSTLRTREERARALQGPGRLPRGVPPATELDARERLRERRGSAAAARPPSPPPCTRPRPTPSSASPPPCPGRPRCATRPRPTGSSESRPVSPCAPS